MYKQCKWMGSGIRILIIISIFNVSVFCSEGKQRWIRKIIIKSQDIFPNTNWLYKWANNLHIPTKRSTILNELTFKEGDEYNELNIVESEKILREKEFIGSVGIEVIQTADDSVDVIISYSEKWSTFLGISYKRDGKYFVYGISLKELNFIGLGYNVSLSLSLTPEGYKREFIFLGQNFLGTRFDLKIQHKVYPNWMIKTVMLTRPFYSLKATWDLSSYYQHFSGEKYISDFNFPGNQFKQVFINSSLFNSFVSISNSGVGKLVGRVGYQMKRESGVNYHRDEQWLSIGIYFWKLTFLSSRYFNFSIDNENIPQGWYTGLALGERLLGRATCFGFYLGLSELLDNYYLRINANFEKYTNFNKDSYEVEYKILRKFRKANILFRIKSFMFKNYEEPVILTADDIRGIGLDKLLINKETLITFEARLFEVIKFWKFYIGFNIFFDKAMLNNLMRIGCGIRLENSVLAGLKVLRIEFAYDFKKFLPVISSGQFINLTEDLNLPMLPPKIIYRY